MYIGRSEMMVKCIPKSISVILHVPSEKYTQELPFLPFGTTYPFFGDAGDFERKFDSEYFKKIGLLTCHVEILLLRL